MNNEINTFRRAFQLKCYSFNFGLIHFPTWTPHSWDAGPDNKTRCDASIVHPSGGNMLDLILQISQVNIPRMTVFPSSQRQRQNINAKIKKKAINEARGFK